MSDGGFVGRTAELGALLACLDEAVAGRLSITVIEGEAGIGKSALVGQLVERARGVRLLFGACEQLESSRPLAALTDAIDTSMQLRRDVLVDVSGDALAPHEIGPAHHRAIDAIGSLLEEMAASEPVLLVVEDVHWADHATLIALRSITKRLRFAPIAVVVTTRPTAIPSRPDELFAAWRDAGARFVRVDPLDEEDVSTLTTELLGASPDDTLRRCVAGAGGNPLFVGELVRTLADEGSIEVGDGTATLLSDALPPTLRLTILRRLSFLSDQELDALRLAAVLGTTFAPGDLAAVMDASLATLLPVLQGSVRAGILHEHGRSMRFRHDLLREVLYEDLPLAIRLDLHRHAAASLAAIGAAPARVAHHYSVAAQRGDRQAVDALRTAAVAERSPAARIELLERARELLDPDDAILIDVEADLAESMAWGGRPTDAETLAREVLRRSGTDQDRARRMRVALTHVLRSAARWRDVVTVVEEAFADGSIEPAARVELLAAEAHARAWSNAHDVRRAVAAADEALRIAEELADDALVCRALVAVSLARYAAAAPGAVDAAARAAAMAERDPRDALLRDRPHHVLGSVHPDPDERARALRTGLRLAEERGWVTDVPDYLTALANVQEARNGWDEAIAEAEAALGAAEEIGAWHAAFMAHSYLAFFALGRGDLATASHHLAEEERLYEQLGPQLVDFPVMQRALMMEAHGDRMGALELRWDAFMEACSHREIVPWKTLLFLALELDRSKVDRVIAWLDDRAARLANESSVREARFARALRDGDAPAMLAVVREAEAAGWPDWVLDVESAARGLATVGLRDEAMPYARAIVDGWVKADAKLFHTWFTDAMRAVGVTLAAPRRTRRPPTGWAALTDSEQRVAALAAEGRTNRKIGEILFISPRTVQAHLAHVFQKLGIGSRVELAAVVARRSVDRVTA